MCVAYGCEFLVSMLSLFWCLVFWLFLWLGVDFGILVWGSQADSLQWDVILANGVCGFIDGWKGWSAGFDCYGSEWGYGGWNTVIDSPLLCVASALF